MPCGFDVPQRHVDDHFKTGVARCTYLPALGAMQNRIITTKADFIRRFAARAVEQDTPFAVVVHQKHNIDLQFHSAPRLFWLPYHLSCRNNESETTGNAS